MSGLVTARLSNVYSKLSKQQKYALIALSYNDDEYSINWNKLNNIYKYQEDVASPKPDELKAIFDGWWYNAGLVSDSPELAIKKQDAAFETYVKGTFDFTNPYTPAGMGTNGNSVPTRQYYLYYTNDQENQFTETNLNTARPNHEPEVLEYVENVTTYSGFLGTAFELWQRVCAQGANCVYGGNVSWSAITGTGSITEIDCSGYVSGAIHNYGYSIGRADTSYFASNDVSSFGTVIAEGTGTGNVAAGIQLKPGDIVVRRRSDGGHVCIIVKAEDGVVYAFDCGMQKYWKDNIEANPINVTKFVVTGVTSNHQYTGKWRVIRVNEK